MENNVHEGPLHQVEVATIEDTAGIGNHLAQTPTPQLQDDPDSGNATVPGSVRVLIRSLIERYQLTREQFVAIYDDHVSCKLLAAVATSQQQRQANARGPCANHEPRLQTTNGAGAKDLAGRGEQGSASGHTPSPVMEGEEQEEEELHGEVGKMQTLVKSAIQSYETSSIAEIGQKRKMFSLEEELNLKPSPFAQELLE